MMEMEELEFMDDDLFKIMKKGKRTMPFEDFEDKVMAKIHYEKSYKGVIIKKLKLSLIFFIIGTFSGITMTFLFLVFGNPLFGISPEMLALPLLFIFSVIGIMSLDNFLRLIKKYSQ